MSLLYQYPFDSILAVICILLAAFAFRRGAKLFARGLKNPEHPLQTLWVVRGFRNGIIGLSLIAFAGGVYFHKSWPLIVGAIFLGEELLETGIMIFVLKRQEKRRKQES